MRYVLLSGLALIRKAHLHVERDVYKRNVYHILMDYIVFAMTEIEIELLRFLELFSFN